MNVDYLAQTSCFDCTNCINSGKINYDRFCQYQCTLCPSVMNSYNSPYYNVSSYPDPSQRLGSGYQRYPNPNTISLLYMPQKNFRTNYVGSYILPIMNYF